MKQQPSKNIFRLCLLFVFPALSLLILAYSSVIYLYFPDQNQIMKITLICLGVVALALLIKGGVAFYRNGYNNENTDAQSIE